MNVYSGKFDQENWYQVFLNGKPFDHRPSLKVVNHSPTGFAWGYGGSGPSQLALAILLNETKDKELALSLYQKFKSDVIARIPQEDDWKLTADEVNDWISRNRTDVTFDIKHSPKSSRRRLTGSNKRHRLTADIVTDPEESCACCDSPFVSGNPSCTCSGNTFSSLCSECSKCKSHCGCKEFGLGKPSIAPESESTVSLGKKKKAGYLLPEDLHNIPLKTSEAQVLYERIMDYMMLADDPMYDKIRSFRKQIDKIADHRDREELKDYFEKEFAGHHTQGTSAWEYYASTSASHKSNKADLYREFISYLDHEEAPTRYRAEEKLLETVRKADSEPELLEKHLRRIIRERFQPSGPMAAIKSRLSKIADSLEDDDDEEMIEEEPPICPVCDGVGVPLGQLGNRKHYRCRQCGMDFSKKAGE